jgi:hypothetical protein
MWGALSDEKSGLYFQFLLGIASAAFIKYFLLITFQHRSPENTVYHSSVLVSMTCCLATADALFLT